MVTVALVAPLYERRRMPVADRRYSSGCHYILQSSVERPVNLRVNGAALRQAQGGERSRTAPRRPVSAPWVLTNAAEMPDRSPCNAAVFTNSTTLRRVIGKPDNWPIRFRSPETGFASTDVRVAALCAAPAAVGRSNGSSRGPITTGASSRARSGTLITSPG